MPSPDPAFATVAELSAAFARRTLSPVDVVDALLARIEKLNPTLHAFIDVYPSDARLAAEAADKAIRSGHAVGPLHGVPISIKDLFDVRGTPTTAASRVREGHVAERDATVSREMQAERAGRRPGGRILGDAAGRREHPRLPASP